MISRPLGPVDRWVCSITVVRAPVNYLAHSSVVPFVHHFAATHQAFSFSENNDDDESDDDDDNDNDNDDDEYGDVLDDDEEGGEGGA